jgi:hypothetical protein
MNRSAKMLLVLALGAACAGSGPDDHGDGVGAGDDAPAPRIDAAPGGLDAGTPGDPPASFHCDVMGGVCVDPAAHLAWEHAPPATPLAWSAAKARCEGLALAGGGWRLPKIQELRSLIRGCANTEIGGACGATDPTCTYRACMAGCDQCPSTIVNGVRPCFWPPELGGSCDAAHWSGTAYQDSVDPGAWYVDFGNGAFVHGWLASQPLLVRCVRDAP